MAIFKDQTVPRKDPSIGLQDLPPRKESDFTTENAPSFEPAPRTRTREAKESVIAADLTMEGKIEGAGHVRMAGRCKGDVNVVGGIGSGSGAKITGSVRGGMVTAGG